jgi:hypothetical protein
MDRLIRERGARRPGDDELKGAGEVVLRSKQDTPQAGAACAVAASGGSLTRWR